jgi:regulator of sigma E protease
MLSSLPDFPRSILAFIVVLGVLVFIHELGHYLAARWRGVYVEVFSIGFGRAIATWTDKVGTVWKLAWLPLGGYVKLHGQERPEDVPPQVRASWKPGQTFHEKSVLSRAIVIAAGPIANFLLAIVLFSAVFAVLGRPVTTSVVGEVIADGAAARGGVQKGDAVTAIGDAPVHTFTDIQRIVSAHPGQPLVLHVTRGGQTLDLPVTPDSVAEGGTQIGKLGIGSDAVVYESAGLLGAVGGGIAQTWDVGVQTFEGLTQMLTGRRGTEDLGGPLRIAQLSGQVAQLGFARLIDFIAVLSVNLGLINLFPIPILDGGHLVFLAAEGARGRPIPPRAQEYGFRAGLAVLLTLFVFATWNDLSHLGVVRWVAGLIS